MSVRPFLSSSWHRVASLRPQLREHATVHRHRYRGRVWYIVHDHATGRVHRVSSAGGTVINAMDGRRTVDELWQSALARMGDDAPSQDDFVQLLARLHAADLLQTEVTPDSAEIMKRSDRFGRAWLLQNVFNPLALRFRLWHPDKFFDRSIDYVRWIFGWPGIVIWLLTVMVAVLLAAQHWNELSADAADRILATDNLILIILCYPVVKTLHELGHGYAVKAFGGAVHEVGLMFLVFAPVPYVDASAASEFRSKWRRALVGAAGMIVEVFVAALALYVWLSVEPGIIRALAYNVLIIASVSTVFFNANPLLRYDGYYILTDLLEIPNLRQRSSGYWGYLAERYIFRSDEAREFAAAPGERFWLVLYAPISLLYRTAVTLGIALFVASHYRIVGVIIAIWGLATGVALPFGQALWQVAAGRRLQPQRMRAVLTTLGAAAVTAVIVLFMPVPLHTTTEGVVWLPETANVRAGTDGFVQRVLVQPGRHVKVGDPLIESADSTLSAELESMRDRVTEIETKLAADRITDRVQAEIATTELHQAQAELTAEIKRKEQLIARSRADGVFVVPEPQDLPGRYVHEGQLIGYVLPHGSRIVRATVGQEDIDLVRTRLRGVSVRLAEQLDEVLQARVIREVPAGSEDLPSKALGGIGGGAVSVDPRDPKGTKSLQRVFQLDLELPAEAGSSAFGSRAYVRFEHSWEPLGEQILRRVRQVLLSRLQT